MDNFHSNFFKTKDNKQLHYSCNFPLDFQREHHNVLVFNYGLVCSNLHWSKQVEYFDQLGHKILLHNYRAHFQSEGRNEIEKLSFSLIADDLESICEHLKLRNIISIGHSMGVNITLEHAVRNQNNVAGAILISGTLLPVEDVMLNSNIMSFLIPGLKKAKTFFPEQIEKLWRFSSRNVLVQEIVHRTGFHSKTVSKDFVEVYLNRVGKLGSELFLQLFDQMSKHSIMSELHKLQIPCLVIGGEDDQIIPNYLQKLLSSRLPNSELYILKRGSHVPQVDFPELINERIDVFIKELTH